MIHQLMQLKTDFRDSSNTDGRGRDHESKRSVAGMILI